jgi:hypothetical protein
LATARGAICSVESVSTNDDAFRLAETGGA